MNTESGLSDGDTSPLLPAIELVDELQNRLVGDAALAVAFASLTPGRQREYNHHISSAKQAKTRESRIDRCTAKILTGKGLRDRDDPTAGQRSAKPERASGDGPVLLSGGNPQIPKGDGPEPVAAYLAAIPDWKQDVGLRLDSLIERAVPDVQKAIRWNSPFYGVEELGWFVSYHCFDRYMKVTFLNGSKLDPLPPVDSKDPNSRYAHIHEDEEIDEALYERWMRQASSLPGWDGF
jgi:hypothetical protein